MTDIDALLSEMTLAEKAGQLNMLAWGAPLTGAEAAGDATDAVRAGKVGSLINLVGASQVTRVQRVAVEETRLKIPLFFGYDILHGHRTMFPLPIAEACAFDPDLWERTARVAAMEGAADGQDVVFAPMVDIARDPRWGRACEGPGEDPWVGARFAEAKTRGFQGAGLDRADAVAGCIKHFVGYGAVRAGREYAPSDIPPLALRETYLPPFEAGVRAGVASLMPALNALDGTPMTVHGRLIGGWLRARLRFEGIVISDYGAIRELIRHGVARGEAEAAALGIKAGCDVDMMGYSYVDHLEEAVARGLCREAEVDVCVRRVLAFKQRLGLFDDPYRRCHAIEPRQPDRVFARQAAWRSIVLLKNKRDLIPVAPRRMRIAVVGPLGDAPREMVGSWAAAADPAACVSVLTGLRTAYPQAAIDCEEGCGIESNDARG
ncbi:MAG: beta-glucosidase, partial [Caulobacteraceae bacterium]|nr:beta-glucosidase [Caulobacter sp.]